MGTDRHDAAFEALFVEVYEPLQRYLRRRCDPESFDDVLNQTLATIWRRRDDVPPHTVLPWCYGVARRCLANERRSRARRLGLVGRIRDRADRPTPFGWVDEIDAELDLALGRLSDLDGEVVRLWAWEQLEPGDIARVLGTSPNAVSARLVRIRRRLRRELARHDPGRAGHNTVERHPEREP